MSNQTTLNSAASPSSVFLPWLCSSRTFRGYQLQSSKNRKSQKIPAKTSGTISLSANLGPNYDRLQQSKMTYNKNTHYRMRFQTKLPPLMAKGNKVDVVLLQMAAGGIVIDIVRQPLQKEVLMTCVLAILINAFLTMKGEDYHIKSSPPWKGLIIIALPFMSLLIYSFLTQPTVRGIAYNIVASMLGKLLGLAIVRANQSKVSQHKTSK